MVHLSLTALLYSQKNIDLAYKSKKICRELSINLINAGDFIDLTMKIIQLNPQIVFFDLSTVRLENQIMELFVAKGQYHIPNIVIIYEKPEDLIQYEKFKFFSVKPSKLDKFLFEHDKTFKLKAALVENERGSLIIIDNELNNHLFNIGFSPKHTGYNYLIEAVKILMKKAGSIGSLNNDVYPLIAAKFGTRVTNVERNIRNAIVCAFNNYNISTKKINCIFSKFKTRPTNREFICLCLEEMRNDYIKKNKKIINS
jgi:hypothetical protein